jgi:RHS repeat-associated protein
MSRNFKDGVDEAVEYTYDANGNMTMDANKRINSIEYNLLNLPQKITFAENANVMNRYIYSATGQKFTAFHQNAAGTHRTDYVGNLVYEDGDLSMIQVDGGYIKNGQYYFYLQDHLGSNRVVADTSGNVVQANHYYPYGTPFAESYNQDVQKYKYIGKEYDTENGLNYYDVEARLLDGPRFTTMDPLAEKYPSISPYAYCMGNPINNVDLRGDSITIVYKNNSLIYNNGSLYNTDGSAYEGKVKGYLKSVVKALGNLNDTKEGAALVSELQNSTNMFTIRDGKNSFSPSNVSKAGANLSEVQSVTGNTIGSTGSGGTIYWSANSTSGGLDVNGNTTRPSYIGLGHEMGHASDSNQGMLYYNNDYTNGVTGATYKSTHNGLLKSEWRAVYKENMIRQQAGLPLRAYYGYNIETGIPSPTLPRLLNSHNLPINY